MIGILEKASAPDRFQCRVTGLLGGIAGEGASKDTYFGQASANQLLEVENAKLRAENKAMREAMKQIDGTLAIIREFLK